MITFPLPVFLTATESSDASPDVARPAAPPQTKTPSPANSAAIPNLDSRDFSAVSLRSPIIVDRGSLAIGRRPMVGVGLVSPSPSACVSVAEVPVTKGAGSRMGIDELAWLAIRPTTKPTSLSSNFRSSASVGGSFERGSSQHSRSTFGWTPAARHSGRSRNCSYAALSGRCPQGQGQIYLLSWLVLRHSSRSKIL
jgi:hypothetical protein